MDKILIVDDDPAVRALLQIVGTRAGFGVDSSADGLDALEKLQANDYLIMVLDLMMPKVNGYDVVQQLSRDKRRPAIVVVTAMTGSYVSALDPGVVHTIVRKPFDIEMMGSLLAAIAASVKATREKRVTFPAAEAGARPQSSM